MKFRFSRTLIALLPLAALLLVRIDAVSQTDDAAVKNGFGQVAVKDVSLSEIDSAHVRVVVDLTITPSRNVSIEDLRLASLRLNGMPVYAEPLLQPIELVQGKETALPPVYVTAQMRDLTTTAPLREMVEKQSVHLEGQVIAGVKMSFLDRLAMHTEHPRVSMPMVQDVPVAFGSTPFARQAALGVLTVIDLGLQGSSTARKTFPGLESQWIHDLEMQANSNLVQVESSFVLKEHDTSYPVVVNQIGFRLASGQILTTAEAKTPWEYETEFLDRIKSGEAKLDKKGFEMQLHMGAGRSTDAPLLLTHKDFSLEERGSAEKDPLIVSKVPKDGQDQDDKTGFAKVEVRRRAAPSALSVIVLQAPPASVGFHAAPAAVVQQDSWAKVAVYRLTVNPDSGKTSVEVVQLSAHRDGQAIRLDQPVDPSFYGSPIVTPEGVLGMVQDEQAGAFLPVDLATASAAGDQGHEPSGPANR